ncbi:HAD family hydrolase [Actinosynnema sp. NPDC051121]
MTKDRFPVKDSKILNRILTDTEALLIDFDGPVCSVFSGISAESIAENLRNLLTSLGPGPIPQLVQETRDPFEVFKYASKISTRLANRIEEALRHLEFQAVDTASSTKFAREVMTSWHSTDRPLAIASNNSYAAIVKYLDMHQLIDLVDCVSARTTAQYANLKPSPYLLNRAASLIGTDVRSCALIGDSPSDILAAQAAGMPAIAYANKPNKRHKLSALQPYYTIESMSEILHALQ